MQQLPAANFKHDPARAARLHAFPQWAGTVVALLGALIIISWYAHWQGILQLIPDTAPMQYNTALCFIMLGTGLFLLGHRRAGFAPWLGTTAGLLAGLTLAEYVTGRDWGIDLLFFKPYFEVATTYPGRMSPLAAACFVCLGTALVLGRGPHPSPRRLAGTGLLACVVGVISSVALGGYFFGIESAYGWGAYSRMAVNTAGAMLLYSSGLLVWSWRLTGQEYYTFLRWLPAAGSITLMAMVGFVATVNTAELRKATYWRQHTFQVILAGQSYLDNLLDTQRGLRGFVTLGDTNALAAYHAGVDLAPQQLARLAADTQDNPGQQKRLQNLDEAMKNLLAFDEHVLATYLEQGFAGVSQLDATGRGRMLFGDTRDILKDFSREEQRLLVVRDASETADYNNVKRLLVAGCVTAAILLLAGNVMAGREMRRRRLTEARLNATLTLQNAIFSSASYAIVSMDRHGIVKTFNPAAEKLLGYPADEVIEHATPQLWCEVKNHGPLPKRIGMETLLAQAGLAGLGEGEATLIRKGGQSFPALVSTTALADGRGNITGFLTVFSDISERKLREVEREKLIAELKAALAEVKTLSGLIPICAWCKNVRSDKGYWQTVEQYVHIKTAATFSHGICPQCAEKMMTESAQ